MLYVAQKRLKVGEAIVEYGELMPKGSVESWDWKTQLIYLRNGTIRHATLEEIEAARQTAKAATKKGATAGAA